MESGLSVNNSVFVNEVMNLVEILVVLSVSTQREVALQNFLTTVAAITWFVYKKTEYL